MVFSSLVFLWIFLPITFCVSRLFKGKMANIFLLFCSLFFYAWGEPIYVFLMLFSIVFNYYIAQAISKYENKSFFLLVALIVDLGALGIFKYYNFVVGTINALCGNAILHERNIPLPIGISFYTFQILSYVIDVYWGKVQVQKKLVNLALYISFFPQLIAGPIVRYKDINEQLEDRQITKEKTTAGFYRFFIGLGKKVLISNVMANIADQIFGMNYIEVGAMTAWIGIISYTLQIYYDFSGYSDMAIGLGKLFGFEFSENFNLPYTAESIKKFWTKWHISLSTWFKEYLYIPLGGNRKGRFCTYRNNLIVFLATGIWHGASWNYVIWGLLHGFFLLLERAGLEKILEKLPKIVQHLYTMFVVMIAWVFFRVENCGQALAYIRAMFRVQLADSVRFILSPKEMLVISIAVFFCGFQKNIAEYLGNKFGKDDARLIGVKYASSIGIYLLAICSLAAGEYNPFIYFRF